MAIAREREKDKRRRKKKGIRDRGMYQASEEVCIILYSCTRCGIVWSPALCLPHYILPLSLSPPHLPLPHAILSLLVERKKERKKCVLEIAREVSELILRGRIPLLRRSPELWRYGPHTSRGGGGMKERKRKKKIKKDQVSRIQNGLLITVVVATLGGPRDTYLVLAYPIFLCLQLYLSL